MPARPAITESLTHLRAMAQEALEAWNVQRAASAINAMLQLAPHVLQAEAEEHLPGHPRSASEAPRSDAAPPVQVPTRGVPRKRRKKA